MTGDEQAKRLADAWVNPVEQQKVDRIVAQTIRETMRALVELSALSRKDVTEENADYVFGVIRSRVRG